MRNLSLFMNEVGFFFYLESNRNESSGSDSCYGFLFCKKDSFFDLLIDCKKLKNLQS